MFYKHTFYLRRKVMNFLVNCIKGIVIGAGAILPGISSGVLCVILGIYEKLLDSVLNFFKNIKNNFKYLAPIVIGAFLGILIFSNFLNYLLIEFPIQTKSIFIGLILGCIPSLVKQCNSKSTIKKNYILYAIATFIIGIVIVMLEKNINFVATSDFSFGYLFVSGFVMSVGIVVPGVSNTIILMLMGVYSTYLSAVSTMFLPVLIPMGLGVIVGSFIFMKIIKILLDECYVQTFYSIIGFSLGSVLVLLPELHIDSSSIISILCMILGFILVSFFEEK